MTQENNYSPYSQSSNQQSTIYNQQSQIGYVVGGSLKDSFRVRLTVPPQDVQAALWWWKAATGCFTAW